MIKPLHDLVVIKVKVQSKTTEGGIITVAELDPDRPTSGIVLAVGPGLYVDGAREELQVAVGDMVAFSRSIGVEYDDDVVGEVKLIHEAEIIAVVG